MNDAGGSGLSLELAARLLAVRDGDLPAATLHAAGRALLDAVGVMQAASRVGFRLSVGYRNLRLHRYLQTLLQVLLKGLTVLWL